MPPHNNRNARQKMRDLESRFSNVGNGSSVSINYVHTKGKIRVNRPSIQRQHPARPSMSKQASVRRPSSPMGRQTSVRRPSSPMGRQTSVRPSVRRPSMGRQASRAAMPKQGSTHNMSKQEFKKGKSKKELKKEKSKKSIAKQPSRASVSRQPIRGDLVRTPSPRGSLNRTPSRGNLQKSKSQQSFKRRPSLSRSQSSGSSQEITRGRRGWRHRLRKVEERPKRGLVIIWLVVLAELSFDLGTTIIAFQAMLEEGDCCGYELTLGTLPLTVATPFIFLVSLELLFLIRAVVITLWPSLLEKTKNLSNEEGGRRKFCFIFFRWSVETLLRCINVLVLLNPFFGCIIAWLLLYQSDKNESHLVLGLEGGSIILHFISVKLEGSVKTLYHLILHCVVPLVPFFVSVVMTIIYLKQGGVCYIVEESSFGFQGCELCPDNSLPIEGMCLVNGTNVTVDDGTFLNLGGDLNDLGGLADPTATQKEFCGLNGNGQPTNFCFFSFEDG